MATIWLTYAWQDNEQGDVDFTAQELEVAGLVVKLDRWNLKAGVRLWEQIQDYITSPEQSDAWVLYATQNSLGSQACREEFTYALDRALTARGEPFPVIALFPATVDRQLIPAGIRTRLFVSLTDPDWKERIKAAAERRAPGISRERVQPYHIQIHKVELPAQAGYAIEVRPRAGTWSPFFAAVPIDEKDDINPNILRGPKGHVPSGGVLRMTGESKSEDGAWWIMHANDEASPTQSYFVFCESLPSRLIFGAQNGPQYTVEPGGAAIL
ncbi:MAG: toll/interleukin-1 receptor domain-containing protein [Anaerolineae bacterium]